MVKGIDSCPTCREPISRLRTVSARRNKILRVRIYECSGCKRTIETVEVVTSSDLGGKRYAARVEEHRGKIKDKWDSELEAQIADLETGINSW